MKQCYGQCDRCVWNRLHGACNPQGLEDDEDEKTEEPIVLMKDFAPVAYPYLYEPTESGLLTEE